MTRKPVDPSLVEIGQAWDFDVDGEHMLVIVVDVSETTTFAGPRRNARVYVVEDVMNEGPIQYSGDYDGMVISFSESHLRRNFKRVS